MKSLLILTSIFISSFLFALDYSVKKVDVLPIESYPAHMTSDDISIAADPYPDDEKSSNAFDVENLTSRGFFPIHIIIRNDSPYFLKLKTQNIYLENRLGEFLYSTPATMVVEDMIGNKYVDSMSHLRDGDRLSDKVATPLSDFTTKALVNSLIEPGTVQSGFLFFFSEKHKRSFFMGSKLHIPEIDEEGTEKSFGPFVIPLDPALTESK